MLIEISKLNKHLNILYQRRFRLSFDSFNSVFLYTNPLDKYDVVQKVNFFLMKTTLFQVDKQVVFSEFSKEPLDSFHVTLTSIFGINQDVIEVYNNKNIKFFRQDFVNIALEAGGGVKRTKRHNLVLEIVVPYLKNCFPLVTLLDTHLMICVYSVQLSKTLGATQAIKKLANQEQQIAILDHQVVEFLIIYTKTEATIFFLNKQYWSTGREFGRPDKITSQVDFNIDFQRFQLYLPQAVYRTIRQLLIVQQIERLIINFGLLWQLCCGV